MAFGLLLTRRCSIHPHPSRIPSKSRRTSFRVVAIPLQQSKVRQSGGVGDELFHAFRGVARVGPLPSASPAIASLCEKRQRPHQDLRGSWVQKPACAALREFAVASRVGPKFPP